MLPSRPVPFRQAWHRFRRAARLSVLLVAGSALAGPIPSASGKDYQEAGTGSAPDTIDTENLFGFTEGTDTGKAGEQEVMVDAIGRFSKRRAGPGSSAYRASEPIVSYQYDPTDDFSIEPGLQFDARDSRNIVGVPDKTFGLVNGGSLEFKYQVLARTDDHPFGIALQAEPLYSRVTPIEGQGADVFSMDTRLMADARLIPGKLWAGANVIYDPSVARLKGSGDTDRSSTLSLSGTLMARATNSVFLGPEIRVMRAYDGSFLNRFLGRAVFVGPVLHVQVREKGFLTVAYSAQVSGHDRAPDFADRAFNLTQFARHNLRVRFGVEF
nr:hypothetical protein NG677_03550 [Methylobacterium sp. OTU13CASTA1]